MRVLGRLRLSVSSDESTSIERQREIITAWAHANSHSIVGFATDVDVSGSVDPWETPEFGPWLNHRAPEFEIIACWKLDRLSRNAIQLSKLFGWAIEHDKTIVSCSESIDLSTWSGRMLASVIAGLAEGELEGIKERSRSSRQKLRQTARWPGGRPPYGYRSYKPLDEPGHKLEKDPHAVKVVRRIVEAVIDGKPLARIADELNREGVVSPADHYRVCNGEEDTDSPWRTGPMKFMLQSPSLRGYAHLKGVTVRDDHGQPVQLAEPLVTDDEWMLLQAELARTQGVPRERGESAPLAGIATCFFCGTRLTLTTQAKKYRYYRCPKACTALIPAEALDEIVEETFLTDYGDQDVVERVWKPGDTTEADIRNAVEALDELTAMVGRMTSETAKLRLQQQVAATDARIRELETSPAQEGRWEYEPTGQKYRDAFGDGSPTERRDLLQRAGITIRIGITDTGGRRSRFNDGVWRFEINSHGFTPKP